MHSPNNEPLLATAAPGDSLPPPHSAIGNRQSQISSPRPPIQHSALSIQHSPDLPLDQAVEHLTIPQRSALTAILEGRTVTAAAKEAGVHRATVHRWLQSHPVFRAAYNAWEHESKTNTTSRLLALVTKALDAVTWSIDDGDGRLAYTLLKDLGLLNKIQESLTDPTLLSRQMQLEHLDLLHSLHLLNVDHHPNPPAPPLPSRLNRKPSGASPAELGKET